MRIKKDYRILFSFMFFFVIFISCTQKQVEFSDLKGAYFGQKPPGDNPELFLPGLITTLDVEYCISFLDQGRVCVFGRDDIEVNYTYIKDGRWTKPQNMELDPQLWEWKHNAGPGDRTLYFMSRRLTSSKDEKEEVNIYKIEWSDSGWTEQEMLPYPPNSKAYHEVYPSVTTNGTVYFHGGDFRNAPNIHQDIYRSRCVNGIFEEQERLQEPISTEYGEYDAFVAPDESYLIFGSDRPGGFGRYDSYICFHKKDESWTHPVNLGIPLNSISWENRVMVTHDGKFMFFVSGRRHKYLNDELEKGKRTSVTGFYWVNTSFISELKEKMLHSGCAADTVWLEYTEHGIKAACKKFVYLKENKDNYHFLPYEFLGLCSQMIESGNIDDADLLYFALLNSIEEQYRIKRGYGMICTLQGLTDKGLYLLKDAMSDYPVEFMVIVFRLGLNLLRKSRTEEALKVMQFNVSEHPYHHISHFGLARVYETIGHREQAIKYCKKALEFCPDYETAAVLLKQLKEQSDSK